MTRINIAGIDFLNPVIAASGTFGFGREYSEFIDLNKIGGISVKGLTLEPRTGNKPPRIAETPGGILNSIGLQNPGIDAFLKKELPYLKGFNTRIIANIAGSTAEDYVKMAEKLSYSDVDAVELNVSCPNVKEGGAAFGNTPEGVKRITSLVRESCRKPLLVKLTPAVSDIRAISKAAQESGADAITLINTLLGMAIDINTKRPILRNNFGGLSGPAIKPIALRMTYEAASSVKIPIIGMGGISKAEDAIEFILAGASAVMIGTWNFVNPRICEEVSEGIKTYLIKNNYSSINDLIGGVILYD